MRAYFFPLVACAVALAPAGDSVTGTSPFADCAWRNGTLRAPSVASQPVQYAVEECTNHNVYEVRGAEQTKRLVKATATTPPQTTGDKGSEPVYPAIGAGHFIKAVRDEGRFVTLEDNSVWDIEPTGRYLTAQWEVLAGIAVRYSGGDDGFVYELANLDKDEGASARWVRK